MKKLIVTLILLLGIIMNAQNQRFIYEYKYAVDSTAKDKTESELMLLDVVPKGSKFYSRDVFESDSVWTAAMEKQVRHESTELNFAGVKNKGKIHYSVEKSHPGYSVNFFNDLGIDRYMVQDERKQAWEILPDKKKIGVFNTQKAVCDFAGRKWTAWFTTDLPIQDGPYKFHGLPGLIVKLEDAARTHSFELKGNKKLPAGYEWQSNKDKEAEFSPLITVNEIKYKKAFKEYCNDPMKSVKQRKAEGYETLEIDDSGKLITTTDKTRRDSEIELKKELKRQNNILELDLLK